MAGLLHAERLPKNAEHKILYVALHLFTEKGFKATSVLDIAEQAHISKTTFYQRFQSKADLLAHLFRHILEEVLGEVEQAVKQERRIAYKAYAGIRRYLQICTTHKPAARLLLVSSVGVNDRVERVRQQAHKKFAELICSTVLSFDSTPGEMHEDIRIVAQAMVGAINEVVLQKIIAPREAMDIERLARLLNRIVVSSFNQLMMEKVQDSHS